MTTPTPPVSPQLWDENRFRAFIRRLKPYTPVMRDKLTRYVATAWACEAAQAHYVQTGDPRFLRVAIPAMAEARRDALVSAGEDPDVYHIIPAPPVMPFNA